MSNSTPSSEQTRTTNSVVPRAVVHKKILDAAESQPAASLEAIADDVSGATISIVEQVLEEYGDPGQPPDDGDDVEATSNTHAELETAGTGTDTASDSTALTDEPPMTDYPLEDNPSLEPPIEPADLTEKQLETLQNVRDRPGATQAELADTLGVTSATISQRVNSIDGFDWSCRREFVDSLFGTAGADGAVEDEPRSDGTGVHEDEYDGHDDEQRRGDDHDQPADSRVSASDSPAASDDSHSDDSHSDDSHSDDSHSDDSHSDDSHSDDSHSDDETLDELAAVDDPASSSDPLSDPELTHKIVHACFAAEYISEDEELRILRAVTADSAESSSRR